MTTRYDSGIASTLTPRGDLTLKAWGARLALDLEEFPIGPTATCANPECGAPVDYLGQGKARLYCRPRCKNRVSEVRRRAGQQLEVIDEYLKATRGKQGIPRDELRRRANLLRFWLDRLPAEG